MNDGGHSVGLFVQAQAIEQQESDDETAATKQGPKKLLELPGHAADHQTGGAN